MGLKKIAKKISTVLLAPEKLASKAVGKAVGKVAGKTAGKTAGKLMRGTGPAKVSKKAGDKVIKDMLQAGIPGIPSRSKVGKIVRKTSGQSTINKVAQPIAKRVASFKPEKVLKNKGKKIF